MLRCFGVPSSGLVSMYSSSSSSGISFGLAADISSVTLSDSGEETLPSSTSWPTDVTSDTLSLNIVEKAG